MALTPAPTLNATRRSTTSGGSRRLRALVLAFLVMLGSLLTGCSASEADLIDTLATTDDAKARGKAATELASRHSRAATETLVASSGANAAAGIAALRDHYLAALEVEPTKALSEKQTTALDETIDCLAVIGDTPAMLGLLGFVQNNNEWIIQQRVDAVGVLATMATAASPPAPAGTSQGALTALVGVIGIPDGWGSDGIRAAAADALIDHPEAAPRLVELRSEAGGVSANWGASTARAVDGVLLKQGEPAAVALVAALAPAQDAAWVPEMLCTIGTPAIAPTGGALTDPDAAVRAGALGALLCLRGQDRAAVDGFLASPDRAAQLVEAHSNEAFSPRYADIEEILFAIGEPAVGPLAGVLGSADWAVDLLGRFGTAAAPELVSLLGDGDPALRARALKALLDFYDAHPGEAAPYLVTPERLPFLVETYASTSVAAEWTLGDVLVASGQPAANAIVGRTVGLVTQEGDWTDAGTALRFYELILRFDPATATNVLVDLVANDAASRQRTLFLAVKLGIPGSEDRLNDLLMQVGDVSMAEDYLNSGSELLSQGGERWATAHGYYVESGPGSHRTTWGSF